MRKILSIFISIISCSLLVTNVNADELVTNATSTDNPNYSTLQAGFNRGKTTINISSPQWVTLYGKSICNGVTCTLEYAGQYSNFEDVLKTSIVCTNGENYITYQSGSSGKTQYSESNEAQHNSSDPVYWTEQYYVTCTTSNSGNSTITLENTGNNNDNYDDNNTGNDGSNVDDSTITPDTNTGNNDEYDTSDTIPNPNQGITEYFVILGIVALISYILMLFVKKLNFFKSV